MAERYTWAQKHLQTSCLWFPLLFTRTYNPRLGSKMVTATLGKCEDKSCFFLCPCLLPRNPKQCWFSPDAAEGLLFSPDLCWAIGNIYSRSNMSAPLRARLNYSPCFFISIPTLKKQHPPNRLISKQHSEDFFFYYSECNGLDLGWLIFSGFCYWNCMGEQELDTIENKN